MRKSLQLLRELIGSEFGIEGKKVELWMWSGGWLALRGEEKLSELEEGHWRSHKGISVGTVLAEASQVGERRAGKVVRGLWYGLIL